MSPLSAHEEELEERLIAAEKRVEEAAALLIQKSSGEDTVCRVVLAATEEIKNRNGEAIDGVVPFWNDLSDSSKMRVGALLGDSLTDTRKIEIAKMRAEGGTGVCGFKDTRRVARPAL